MSKYLVTDDRKVTAKRLREMKARGEKIAMLTAYDFTTARLLDEAGVDALLIGDSASNVKAGHATTLPITVEQMIYHAQCVVRATRRALVVCDMPFGSYQISPEDGLRNAIRMVKESGCDALKLEGGREVAETVRRIVTAGIPVVGHLGLTPQSVNQLGGFAVQAREVAAAQRLMDDAETLAAAGCFAIVLEKIPAALTAQVVEALDIPLIGIGGGPADGQVLVVDDILGMNPDFSPKFLRRYADLHAVITDAVAGYVADVKSGDFPAPDEQY